MLVWGNTIYYFFHRCAISLSCLRFHFMDTLTLCSVSYVIRPCENIRGRWDERQRRSHSSWEEDVVYTSSSPVPLPSGSVNPFSSFLRSPTKETGVHIHLLHLCLKATCSAQCQRLSFPLSLPPTSINYSSSDNFKDAAFFSHFTLFTDLIFPFPNKYLSNKVVIFHSAKQIERYWKQKATQIGD